MLWPMWPAVVSPSKVEMSEKIFQPLKIRLSVLSLKIVDPLPNDAASNPRRIHISADPYLIYLVHGQPERWLKSVIQSSVIYASEMTLVAELETKLMLEGVIQNGAVCAHSEAIEIIFEMIWSLENVREVHRQRRVTCGEILD
jgi:predicted neuraminidase